MMHTPGPWLRDGYTVYALNDDTRPSNRFYASVQIGSIGRGLRTDEQELEANAKLICASPELLAALEQSISALAFMLDEEIRGENRPEWVRIKRDRLDAARAAIAKATMSADQNPIEQTAYAEDGPSDASMLDWLEKSTKSFCGNYSGTGFRMIGSAIWHGTLREAIAGAMQSENPSRLQGKTAEGSQ